MFRIVETDNFGGDYPDERFVELPLLREEAAKRIAAAINAELCPTGREWRFWKVVPDDYVLAPGFEP